MMEDERAIWGKTEKATIRAMSGAKLIEKKSSQELMDLLRFEETLDRIATANFVQVYVLV